MAVKKTDRRQQVRQQRTERTVSFVQRMRDTVGFLPLSMCVAFFVLATLIALYGPRGNKYVVGQKTEQPIYAEVDFEVRDEQETLRQQQAARASAPSHYRTNEDLIAKIGTGLRNLYQAAQAAETFEAYQEGVGDGGVVLDKAAFERLHSYTSEAAQDRFEERINKVMASLPQEYTWDSASAKERTPESTAEFVVVHEGGDAEGGSEETKEIGVFKLTPISNSTSLRRAADELAGRFDPALRAVVSQVVFENMSAAPMLVFDLAATNAEMTRLEEAVEEVKNSYKRGQPIIAARTDTGLSAADLQLLGLHDRAYRAFLGSDEEGAKELRDRELFRRIGIATVFGLITIGLFGYVGTYQRRIFQIKARFLALVLLLSGVLLAVRVIDARPPIKDLVYAPPLFAASVLAVAYSRRFATGVMAFLSVMVLLSIDCDAGMLVTLMVGVGATVNMLDEIRTRTRLLWVGAISATAVFISATAFQLIDGQALGFSAIRGCWAAGGAALSALMIQATLPLIERVFRIATSLTLLEWRDPTRPLLQRLAREAPGTYTHSLAIGTFAEAACDAIGSNGLLAQLAALYHDIGKLHKPEYFTENQSARINRHDKLAPSMSLLIIIGHVKDGIEMAKQYKIPRVLHPFIEEHHGTTVVRYFHHIASEKQPQIASGKHDREVPEANFRYPGPKPKSKESAILMICDSSEGAVRSLAEPTPLKIEQLVHQIVTDRLTDGQFDECDITLRELHLVEESLVKSLCGHYHGRIAYPKREKPDAAAAPAQEAGQKSIA